jgi:hypothetical protein
MSYKFVNSKKPREYANRLNGVKQELAELREKLKALKAEEESLTDFLAAKSANENFQFNGDEGYLMQLEFSHRTRKDIDATKVQAIFAKLGKAVPMKTSEWVQTKISYVSEE